MDSTGGGYASNKGPGAPHVDQVARKAAPGASHGGRGGRSGSSVSYPGETALTGSGPAYGDHVRPSHFGSGGKVEGQDEVITWDIRWTCFFLQKFKVYCNKLNAIVKFVSQTQFFHTFLILCKSTRAQKMSLQEQTLLFTKSQSICGKMCLFLIRRCSVQFSNGVFIKFS